jgi:hypothetical protein
MILSPINIPWQSEKSPALRFTAPRFQPIPQRELGQSAPYAVRTNFKFLRQIDQNIDLADIQLPHKVCLINPLNQGILYTRF